MPEAPSDSEDDQPLVPVQGLAMRKEEYDYNNNRCSRCHKVRVWTV